MVVEKLVAHLVAPGSQRESALPPHSILQLYQTQNRNLSVCT